MTISANHFNTERAAATAVSFTNDTLHLTLNDGRIISLPMEHVPWLQWLRRATPEQRADWSIEPGGFAVHWEALDNGIEVGHLLALDQLA